MLVLAAAAGFGTRSIGKPIRAIGQVLIQLADGNKDVKIPYVSRGDEVGDNARAADSFWEKLVGIEEMELAQKQTRKMPQRSARLELADQVQAAVGRRY